MLTTREAFKFGFLARCVDEHLTQEQICQRVEQGLEKAASMGKEGISPLLATVLLGGLALGGAGLTGAAGGALTHAVLSKDVDPAEAKMQELAATYRQHAARAQEAAARRKLRYEPRLAPTPPTL